MLTYALYLLPLLLILGIHLYLRRRRHEIAESAWTEAKESGLTEPPTLHPVIDANLCFGSGSCAKACPEEAIGVVDGKGFLVNPAACIGHGACAAACPIGAIRLVFGTAKRGVELPLVNPDFESNVPGLFVAGELGGMGLIRKAVEQGKSAVANIEKKRGRAPSGYDLVIVGAGPAGIAASLSATERKLKYVTLEQEHEIGGTTAHYPRGKVVMTAPMTLPIVGRVRAYEISKEKLMELWSGVLEKVRPSIRFGERVEDLSQDGEEFVVRTSRGEYRARTVLLAIGRRGTPRRLGRPGEELPKVVYRLIESEQYRGQAVLVVGGGDSALEAALACAGEPETRVALSYRGNAFNRVKEKNRTLVDEASAAGRLRVLLETEVDRIEPGKVVLTGKAGVIELDNDAVIVCAGGELPTPMLKRVGISIEAHYGE